MSMYHVFEATIRKGGFDLNALTRRINTYHVEGELSDDEREKLITKARGGADAGAGLDLPGEVQRLWAEIGKLRYEIALIKAGITSSDGVQDGIDVLEIPAWIQPIGAHDAYYAGAVVRWDGKVYECIAPQGVACIWNPETMPGYWAEVQIEETEEITDSDDVGGEV